MPHSGERVLRHPAEAEPGNTAKPAPGALTAEGGPAHTTSSGKRASLLPGPPGDRHGARAASWKRCRPRPITPGPPGTGQKGTLPGHRQPWTRRFSGLDSLCRAAVLPPRSSAPACNPGSGAALLRNPAVFPDRAAALRHVWKRAVLTSAQRRGPGHGPAQGPFAQPASAPPLHSSPVSGRGQAPSFTCPRPQHAGFTQTRDMWDCCQTPGGQHITKLLQLCLPLCGPRVQSARFLSMGLTRQEN